MEVQESIFDFLSLRHDKKREAKNRTNYGGRLARKRQGCKIAKSKIAELHEFALRLLHSVWLDLYKNRFL